MNEYYTNLKADDETKEQVDDALRNLLEICQINNLPMYACVAIDNSGDTTEYDSVVHNTTSHDVVLKNDRIKKHMLIADGFDAVPPRNVMTLNMGNILQN